MYLKKISRRRKCKVENRTVLIKNIPWVVKDEAIEILCGQFGKVQSVFKRENVYEEYSRSLCVSFYEAETASRLLHLGQLKYLYTMLKVCTAHKKYQPVRLANGDLIFYNQEIMKKDANMLHVKPKKESQQNASPLSVSDSNSSSNFQTESENTVNVESNLVDQNSNYTVQKYSRTSKTCNSSRSTRRPSLRLSNLGLEYQYFYGNKKHRKESRAHDRQRMSKFFNYRENIEICFDDDRCSKEERKSEMYFSKLFGIMQYPEQFFHWEKRDIYQKAISGNTSSTPPDNHKITFKNKTSEKSLNLEHKNIFTVDNGWYAKDENVRERIATIILSLIEEDKITVEHQEQLSRDSEGSIHPRTISTSSSSRIDDDHISLENIASPKSMNLEPINVFFDESNQNTEDDMEENMSLMLSAFLGQDEISLEYALKYSKILSVFKEQERCVGRKIRWKGFQPIWSTPSQENYDISPNGYFDKLQPIAPCIQDEIDVTWNAVLRLNKLLFELDVKLKTKEYDEFNSSQSQEIIQHPMKQLIENNMSCPIWPAFVFPVTPSVNASNFLSPLYFNSSCDSSSYIQNDFSQDSFTRILQIGSRDL